MEEANKRRFAFFENYYSAASILESQERQGKFLLAIVRYMFEDESPEWDKGTLEKNLWQIVLPSLNFSKKQRNNGTATKGKPRPGMEGNNHAAKPNPSPPTLDEVKEYAKEINYLQKSELFYDYHEGKGWPLNWKASMRYWKQKDEQENQSNPNRLRISATSPEDYEGEF